MSAGLVAEESVAELGVVAVRLEQRTREVGLLEFEAKTSAVEHDR